MSGGFGAFGKIPSLGDFFRFGLSRDFIEPWDSWLQDRILSSQDTLGDGWTNCYLSAPIWRFSLPAGQAGSHAMSGIIMASIDRVGRKFPLTFAAPMETENTVAHHFSNTDVFEELESLALRSLEDTTTRDAIQEGLVPLEFRDVKTVLAQTHPGGETWQSENSPIPCLAAQSIGTQTQHSGIWSTSLEKDHRIMTCKELPNAGQMVGMLDLEARLWNSLTPEVVL